MTKSKFSEGDKVIFKTSDGTEEGMVCGIVTDGVYRVSCNGMMVGVYDFDMRLASHRVAETEPIPTPPKRVRKGK